MPGIQELWSLTPNSNQTADPQINWREGMAPSQVNDSARTVMTKVKQTTLDRGGGIVTGGTSTAYTIATNEGITSLEDGMCVSARIHATNGANPTLKVDGTAAAPIRSLSGTAVPLGGLLAGLVCDFVYFAEGPAWVLKGAIGLGGKYVGEMFEYAGPNPPPFCLQCNGALVSRTTYAPLFAVIGTTYGAGDGSTTFALPDHRGRVVAGLGGGGVGRLTNVPDQHGGSGGNQNHTLTIGEMPTHSHGVTDPGHTHSYSATHVSDRDVTTGGTTANDGVSTQSTTAALTGISIQNQGGGVAHNNVQPTIVQMKCIYAGS